MKLALALLKIEIFLPSFFCLETKSWQKPKCWQTNQFQSKQRIPLKKFLPKNPPEKFPKNSQKISQKILSKKSSQKNPPNKILQKISPKYSTQKIRQKKPSKEILQKKSSRKIPKKFQKKFQRNSKKFQKKIITNIALRGRNPFRACLTPFLQLAAEIQKTVQLENVLVLLILWQL